MTLGWVFPTCSLINLLNWEERIKWSPFEPDQHTNIDDWWISIESCHILIGISQYCFWEFKLPCRAKITGYTLETNSPVSGRCANHMRRGDSCWEHDSGPEQEESSWRWYNDQIFLQWSALPGLKNSILQDALVCWRLLHSQCFLPLQDRKESARNMICFLFKCLSSNYHYIEKGVSSL